MIGMSLEGMPASIDIDKPNTARVYDYYLGGACNLEVDRAFADKIIELVPEVRQAALLNRRFLRRAVSELAKQGITQFVDLGSGVPTVGHVHEIARGVAPEARVLYVDAEPVAVAHAEHILADVPGTGVVQADLRSPDAILHSEQMRKLIDWSQPVAVLMVAVLHFIQDGPELTAALQRYKQKLVPGSALVISHATPDPDPARLGRAAELYRNANTPFVVRDKTEITRFFDGMRILDPGVVWTPLWRPEPGDETDDAERAAFYAGVAIAP